MNILIIEDDVATAEFVVGAFKQVGYTTTHVADGETGLAAALHGPYDAAVVDIMLPKLDGLEVIRRLRAAGRALPIIVLSARGSVDAKIRGLEAGGDDYLAKPFSVAELVARVQALLRRASRAEETTVLKVDDLEMDLVTHRVTRAGELIDLQPLEFLELFDTTLYLNGFGSFIAEALDELLRVGNHLLLVLIRPHLLFVPFLTKFNKARIINIVIIYTP